MLQAILGQVHWITPSHSKCYQVKGTLHMFHWCLWIPNCSHFCSTFFALIGVLREVHPTTAKLYCTLQMYLLYVLLVTPIPIFFTITINLRTAVFELQGFSRQVHQKNPKWYWEIWGHKDPIPNVLQVPQVPNYSQFIPCYRPFWDKCIELL